MHEPGWNTLKLHGDLFLTEDSDYLTPNMSIALEGILLFAKLRIQQGDLGIIVTLCMQSNSTKTLPRFTLSILMLAFHFFEAALPANRSNSVGLTVCPLLIWTAPLCVRKVPRAALHTTSTLSGACAALCKERSSSESNVQSQVQHTWTIPENRFQVIEQLDQEEDLSV